MARTSRRASSRQHSEYLAHQRRVEAGTIGTRYPHVHSVTLELVFVDDKGKETGRNVHRRESNNGALFVYKCPYWECDGGGHDIDEEIDRLLKDRVPETEGRHVCQGWQDSERVNKHRCLGELRYILRAEYADGPH